MSAHHRKLGRDPKHRWAMLRNMVTSLIVHQRIKTTVPKAKELRRVADKMVTLAKKGTLHHRRQALTVIRTDEAMKILFDEMAERYKDRPGGYTRIMKLPKARYGDAAEMAYIEYVDREGEFREARTPWKYTDLLDDLAALELEQNGEEPAAAAAGEDETEASSSGKKPVAVGEDAAAAAPPPSP